MKKLTMFTAWLLIAATLLLCGCTSGDGGTEDGAFTTPADGEATQSPEEVMSFVLATGDGSAISITRSEYGNEIMTTASLNLRKAIEAKIGNAPELKTDWEKDIPRNSYGEVAGKEILIGNTNRVESRDALAELEAETFVIKCTGEKLVIVGANDYATKNAVDYFIEHYVDTAEGEVLAIPANLNYVGQASIQKIEMAEGADLRIMTFNIAGSTKEYDERKEHISTAIIDYLPDVVGIQEANKTCHSQILCTSVVGEYYAMNHPTHRNSSTVNYTAILYLKSKYKQVEGGVEWLNSRYKLNNNTKSLSWTVLERLSDGKRFIVVNMHGALWLETYKLPAGETHASMKEKASSAWKKDNAQQMIDKITELQNKYGSIPAFTTGDYNFNSNNAAYRVMQSTGLKSAQDTAASAVKGASYHSNVGAQPDAGGLAIDHIFYTPDTAKPLVHFICKRPSDLAASDHCPVYTDFALN
ncbi:MAG: endonuclease/exonuclease/phosphatase family protein [Clostridia bacterium]|nr:endonuclease/exonuclease/phosphatase family protein [Clostridia bacterium]